MKRRQRRAQPCLLFFFQRRAVYVLLKRPLVLDELAVEAPDISGNADIRTLGVRLDLIKPGDGLLATARGLQYEPSRRSRDFEGPIPMTTDKGPSDYERTPCIGPGILVYGYQFRDLAMWHDVMAYQWFSAMQGRYRYVPAR